MNSIKFGTKSWRVEYLYGFTFFLSDHEWVMIRPSGTEFVLRTYVEVATKKIALDNLKPIHETIL